MKSVEISDIIIVGGGPVGLYGTYYAGMRGLSVHLIENFDEVGGQPLNIYPEKEIFDVAGLPESNGSQLTANLLKQLEQIDYSLSVGTKVNTIKKEGEIFKISTSKGEFQSRSLVLTTGHGLLKPRLLGVEGEETALAEGKLAYFVTSISEYEGARVAVLGGGDSALDWALTLTKVAKQVYLIHRRTGFRAAEATLARLDQTPIEVLVPYTVKELPPLGLLLSKIKGEEELTLGVDKILVNYGFLIEDAEIVPGLDMTSSRRVRSGLAMRTNIPGLYAAGDVSDYEGKVPLISVGFGEVVIAINDITHQVSFDHQIRHGHSSSIFGKK